LVKQVLSNFVSSYNNSILVEQRKRLLRQLIRNIYMGESREIDSIQIQINNDVVRNFTKQGEEKSSTEDDFSSPFSILIDF
jgi:site-specific DNA recombinase